MRGRPQGPDLRAPRRAGRPGHRHLIEIPPRLAAWAGATPWLATVPGIVERALERWELTFESTLDSGYSWAGAVRRADGTPAVLKVSWPGDDTVLEPAALRAWGDAACAVYESDGEALLLERLEPGTPTDDDAVLASTISALWVPPPAGHPWRTVATLGPRHAATVDAFRDDLGHDLADEAARRWRSLRPGPDDVLLHGDAHHGNVLLAARGWVAIDPQPWVGERALDLGAALYNGPTTPAAERVGVLAAAAGLDVDRVAWAALAWCAVSAAWHFEDGLSQPEIKAARSLAAARALL